jgi:hypothetical protein
MIYILSNINDYYKNNIYLNNLISKYYFLKLEIFFYLNDLIDFINVLFSKKNYNNNRNCIKNINESIDETIDENIHDIKNDIKIIFTNINDYNNISRKLIYINKNNLFFFDINYFNKKNRNIDVKNRDVKNKNNINIQIIVNNIVLKNKNNFYLPYNLISNFISKNNYKLNNKIYEIGILNNQYSNFINKNIKHDKNITLLNDIFYNIKIINDYDYDYDLISKLKIFIYFNDGYFDEYLITKNIYNKVIIITNNSFCFNNYYLKDYIIQYDKNNDVNNNNLYKITNNTLINYEKIYNKIFKDFDINNFDYYLRSNVCNIFNIKNENIGFIIIRNVISEKTNEYWQECYNCIRKYYNNLIIIIDDNSNPEFINSGINLKNCHIIKSEFNGVGEILGYYYYYKYNFFKKAVIIHDSVFINKKINFDLVENIKFIWHFSHEWDTETDEIKLLNNIFNYNLENNDLENNISLKDKLINFYYEKSWMGCFGIQTVISYNFLQLIFDKYRLYNLIHIIKTRDNRMNLERIFGLICTFENKNLIINSSFYGKIHHYIHWGYTFDMYLNDRKKNNLDKYDIIKVWSGR